MDDLDYSRAQEIADVRMKRPHVVILGAGASRATCPKGDKNGRPLPVMMDFARLVGLTPLFKDWGIDADRNFEDTYSDLFEAGETEKLKQLNERVEDYFGVLALPDHPTVYDYLVLSLRETDLIATFNWDPLLLQAYRRHPRRFRRPKVAFVHGNVLAGYCPTDEVMGWAGVPCSSCGEPLARTPLLYPVRHKNYAKDGSIAVQWDLLKHEMRQAFMFTIFGYGGPKTDQEAIDTLSEAWGSPSERSLEQTDFITLQSTDEVRDVWSRFIHSHHYDVTHDFFDSWVAKHPRRTGEAYLAQYLDARFVEGNPPPQHVSLEDLWAWYDELLPAEQPVATKAAR
jgi:hypothetical protein